MHAPLFDALPEEDEVTAQHSPDPDLLKRSAIRSNLPPSNSQAPAARAPQGPSRQAGAAQQRAPAQRAPAQRALGQTSDKALTHLQSTGETQGPSDTTSEPESGVARLPSFADSSPRPFALLAEAGSPANQTSQLHRNPQGSRPALPNRAPLSPRNPPGRPRPPTGNSSAGDSVAGRASRPTPRRPVAQPPFAAPHAAASPPIPSRAVPPQAEGTPGARIRVLPLESLKRLLERYSDCAGPAARPIILQEIARLHATPEQFPLLLRAELISALAARLDNETTRELFEFDARSILETPRDA